LRTRIEKKKKFSENWGGWERKESSDGSIKNLNDSGNQVVLRTKGRRDVVGGGTREGADQMHSTQETEAKGERRISTCTG